MSRKVSFNVIALSRIGSRQKLKYEKRQMWRESGDSERTFLFTGCDRNSIRQSADTSVRIHKTTSKLLTKSTWAWAPYHKKGQDISSKLYAVKAPFNIK